MRTGLVFSCYITGGMQHLHEAQRIEIRRYLFGQIESEGGWGMYVLFDHEPRPNGPATGDRANTVYACSSRARMYSHCEGPSTMFGTALNYCVLRLLGVPADEPRMAKARAFMHLHGMRRLLACSAHAPHALMHQSCI